LALHSQMAETKTLFKIEQKLSEDFKTLVADGAFVGVTPHGKIYINFFVDQFPIASFVEHQLIENGQLGDEINREIPKGDLIRTFSVGVALEIPVALSLINLVAVSLKAIDASTGQNHDSVSELNP